LKGEIGEYYVIRFEEDIAVTSDISELRTVVQGLVDEGVRRIAVAFTEESYLSSRSGKTESLSSSLAENEKSDGKFAKQVLRAIGSPSAIISRW